MTTRYDARFFERRQAGALASARAIVPLIIELLHPASVIDVGCARGEWLAVFRQHGVERTVGVDGDYVDPSRLLIPREMFLVRDLARELEIAGGFDLALSLEVAEHLPAASADTFVADLAGLAPAVLFSAAVPHQGGTGHSNEQWPSYWAERFERHEMIPVDVIRPRFWRQETIASWYRQNTLLYVRRELLERHRQLREAWQQTHRELLDVVLPRFYAKRVEPTTRQLWRTLRKRLIGF